MRRSYPSRLSLLLSLHFFTLFIASKIISADEESATFAGTWKLNPGKSTLTGGTFSFATNASGGIHHQNGLNGYDFDLSGQEFPRPAGGTVSARALGPNGWELTLRTERKITAVLAQEVSGDTLTVHRKDMRSDGTTAETALSAKRLEGGPGPLGRWQFTEISGAETLQIVLRPNRGITWKMMETEASCAGAFDGKDYPVTKSGLSTKLTAAFKQTDPRQFEMTAKASGQPVSVRAFSLSEDGRTLIEEYQKLGANERTKSVYDRQPGLVTSLAAEDTKPILSKNLKSLEREIGEWRTVWTNAALPSLPEGPYIGLRFRANEQGEGIRVSEVVPGGPAAIAGLQEGDVIVELNGHTLKNPEDYHKHRQDLAVGSSVPLKFSREGTLRETQVRMAPAEDSQIKAFLEKFKASQAKLAEPRTITAEIASDGNSIVIHDSGAGFIYYDPELKQIIRLHVLPRGPVIKSVESKDRPQTDEYSRKEDIIYRDGGKSSHTRHVKWIGNDKRLEWVTDVPGDPGPPAVMTFERIKQN